MSLLLIYYLTDFLFQESPEVLRKKLEALIGVYQALTKHISDTSEEDEDLYTPSTSGMSSSNHTEHSGFRENEDESSSSEDEKEDGTCVAAMMIEVHVKKLDYKVKNKKQNEKKNGQR